MKIKRKKERSGGRKWRRVGRERREKEKNRFWKMKRSRRRKNLISRSREVMYERKQ